MAKLFEFTSKSGPMDDYSKLLVRLVLAAQRGKLMLPPDKRPDAEQIETEVKKIGQELHNK
jgi:hypothetical protein